MSTRKNFTLDREAAQLLDDHPDENHSELVRELLKAYYTAGCYDTEQAAVDVRKRKLERQSAEVEAELESIQEELENLKQLSEDMSETSNVSEAASELVEELGITPEKATAENPAVRKRAERNGIEPDVLAEVVRERAEKKQREQFKSLATA